MPDRRRGDVGSGAAHPQRAEGRSRSGARDRGGHRRGDSMTGNGDDRPTACEEDVRPDPEGRLQPASEEVPWLLRHKVGLPDPVEGYVERPELEERCALLDRRLTVLHAAGGFGKTALLARCCRALREQGIAVAWLSLDEEDGPGSLATHLAHAFEEAGLATFGPAGERGGATRRRTRKRTVRPPIGSSCCSVRSRATARRACWRWTSWSVCAARRPPPRSTCCWTADRTTSMSGWRSGISLRGWRLPGSRSRGGRRR